MSWVQIVAALLAAVFGWMNRDGIMAIVDRARGKEPNQVDLTSPVQAVQTLLNHFEAKGCKRGIEAARTVGTCLFDAPAIPPAVSVVEVAK